MNQVILPANSLNSMVGLSSQPGGIGGNVFSGLNSAVPSVMPPQDLFLNNKTGSDSPTRLNQEFADMSLGGSSRFALWKIPNDDKVQQQQQHQGVGGLSNGLQMPNMLGAGSDFSRAPGGASKPSQMFERSDSTSSGWGSIVGSVGSGGGSDQSNGLGLLNSNNWSAMDRAEASSNAGNNGNKDSSNSSPTGGNGGGNGGLSSNSLAAAAAAAVNYADLVPEFEPGKPWKGNTKNPEDDPTITPGSLARSPLSLPVKADMALFGANWSNSSKTSPSGGNGNNVVGAGGNVVGGGDALTSSLSLSSSTWSFSGPNSSANSLFSSGADVVTTGNGTKMQGGWGDGSSSSGDNLWGGNGNKPRGPPPGLSGQMKNGSNGNGGNAGSSWGGFENNGTAGPSYLLLRNLTSQVID